MAVAANEIGAGCIELATCGDMPARQSSGMGGTSPAIIATNGHLLHTLTAAVRR